MAFGQPHQARDDAGSEVSERPESARQARQVRLLPHRQHSPCASCQPGLVATALFSPAVREHPSNAAPNVCRGWDGTWFVQLAEPDKATARALASGRTELLTDPRFATPPPMATNKPQLAEI